MVNFINGIPNGRIVLTGIQDEASRSLNSACYTALQSLGLSTSTTFKFRDGFAMVGIKGAAAGSVD